MTRSVKTAAGTGPEPEWLLIAQSDCRAGDKPTDSRSRPESAPERGASAPRPRTRGRSGEPGSAGTAHQGGGASRGTQHQEAEAPTVSPPTRGAPSGAPLAGGKAGSPSEEVEARIHRALDCMAWTRSTRTQFRASALQAQKELKMAKAKKRNSFSGKKNNRPGFAKGPIAKKPSRGGGRA